MLVCNVYVVCVPHFLFIIVVIIDQLFFIGLTQHSLLISMHILIII